MRTLEELIKHGVKGRRVLVRCDLNVPLSDGQVTDVCHDKCVIAN